MVWASLIFLNAMWFSAAFVQFSFAQRNTVKILVPCGERDNPLAATLGASVAFLGGMNGAIATFCFFLIAGPDLLIRPEQKAFILVFLALVNLSQFAFNIPILVLGGRRGIAYWPVLQGPHADALHHRWDCCLA